jgi:hypothetical protein
MARRPPEILSVTSSAEGGMTVTWQVDEFFGDSEAGEKVLVELNGLAFQELDGDETSVDVDGDTLARFAPGLLTVGVIFWWSGNPAEEQHSAIQVPLHSSTVPPGNQGIAPAAKPVVTIVRVQPRTAAAPSQVTIAWKSNNYNDGNIHWGPQAAPRQFTHNIRPVGTVYEGTWTTDRPLASATGYVFTVSVRNTLHSPPWIETSIVAMTAADVLSVRAFLVASGAPPTGGVRAAMGAERSVHRWLTGH